MCVYTHGYSTQIKIKDIYIHLNWVYHGLALVVQFTLPFWGIYTYMYIYICKYIVYTHSLFYLVPSAFDEAGGVQSKPRFHLRTP